MDNTQSSVFFFRFSMDSHGWRDHVCRSHTDGRRRQNNFDWTARWVNYFLAILSNFKRQENKMVTCDLKPQRDTGGRGKHVTRQKYNINTNWSDIQRVNLVVQCELFTKLKHFLIFRWRHEGICAVSVKLVEEPLSRSKWSLVCLDSE